MMNDYDLLAWCNEYSVDSTFTKKESISDIMKCIILKSVISVHKGRNEKTDIRTIFKYLNDSNMNIIRSRIAVFFDQYIEEEHLSYRLAQELFQMAYESLYLDIYKSPWFQRNVC